MIIAVHLEPRLVVTGVYRQREEIVDVAIKCSRTESKVMQYLFSAYRNVYTALQM